MNKYITVSAVALLTVGAAQAQDFIAGLDFGVNPFSTDVPFDSGSGATENGSFTLIIQSGAGEDNLSWDTAGAFGPGFGTFSEPNWAALGENYTDEFANVLPVGGTADIPITVQNISAGGFTPSTSVFGGTSANAQGFSATSGIAFGSNVNGLFQIGVGPSSLGGGFDNVLLNFDAAALVAQGNTPGNLSVNGNNVALTASPANFTVNLGNLAAGSFINFDLTNLPGGASFDNFMIAGTAVVPEPSTYAAIIGALALGFVALRRRK